MANDVEQNKCPCKKNYSCTLVKCKKCSSWWHTRCVGLSGLTSAELGRLKDWQCPLCYRLPEGVNQVCTLETIQREITDLRSELEVKVGKVMEHVEEKADSQTKKWSDLFAQKKDEKQMEQVVTQVMEKSKQKMDHDHVERERRKKNIVVRDVVESDATSNDEKREADKLKTIEILGINEEDIELVIRAGKPSTEADSPPRPLIITVKTPEMASALHGYGRGKRVNSPDDDDTYIWINPDLIEADRKANYRAREERRKMRSQHGRPTPGVVTRRESFLNSQTEPASEH